jgi:hypothetical protein
MISELFEHELTLAKAFEGTLKAYGGSLKSKQFNVNRLGYWLSITIPKRSLRSSSRVSLEDPAESVDDPLANMRMGRVLTKPIRQVENLRRHPGGSFSGLESTLKRFQQNSAEKSPVPIQ